MLQSLLWRIAAAYVIPRFKLNSSHGKVLIYSINKDDYIASYNLSKIFFRYGTSKLKSYISSGKVNISIVSARKLR